MSVPNEHLPLWYRRARKVVRLRYRAWREQRAEQAEPEFEPELDPEPEPSPEPEFEPEPFPETAPDPMPEQMPELEPQPAQQAGPPPEPDSAPKLKQKSRPEPPPLLYSNGTFDLGSFGRYPREKSQAAIRSLCRYSYLGNNEGVTWVLGRYKMFVDTRDDSLSAQLILDGFWETWVTEVLVRLVQRGAVVADIGANLGYYSILMADLVGSAGRVHCFEPNPHLVHKLERSLALNGMDHWCRIHQFPLGARDDEKVIFYASEREPKNGAIFPLPVRYDRATMPAGSRLMQTTRLDSWDEWNEIELAKIDVEGAEELIWQGATKLLEGDRLHTIILEFTPVRYADPAAFLDQILAAGFEPSLIDPGRGVIPITRKAILSGQGGEDQMLLLRRGSALPRNRRRAAAEERARLKSKAQKKRAGTPHKPR